MHDNESIENLKKRQSLHSQLKFPFEKILSFWTKVSTKQKIIQNHSKNFFLKFFNLEPKPSFLMTKLLAEDSVWCKNWPNPLG